MILLVAAGLLHGGKKGFLVGEVLEKEGFRNARRIGQLPGCRAVETLFGEYLAHRPDDRRPAFLTRQLHGGFHSPSCLLDRRGKYMLTAERRQWPVLESSAFSGLAILPEFAPRLWTGSSRSPAALTTDLQMNHGAP